MAKIRITNPNAPGAGPPAAAAASSTSVEQVNDTGSEDGAPSQRAIVKRYTERRGKDQFNFEERILAGHITSEGAMALIPSAKAGEWNEPAYEVTRANVMAEVEKLLPAYWSQANRCNELAAGVKAVQELLAYAFLVGDAEFSEELRRVKRDYFGKRVLVAWCEKYGVDWKELDDGDWVEEKGGVPETAEDVLGG